MLAEVVDRDDLGVGQLGCGSRLVLESASDAGLRVEGGMHQLDCDGAVEPGVPTVADFRHSAAAQHGPQFVAVHEKLVAGHAHTVARFTAA